MRLLLAANNQPTRRNEIIKSYLKTGFKQQPICTPLAPTRNKIIYKTACSDGPEKLLKTASLKRASLVHTVGRYRLGPEHVQNSTPKPGPTQTPCAPPVRELWVACSATQELPTRLSYAPRTLEQKSNSVGTKKSCAGSAGQKSLCWTRKSHIGTLLPGDVNLHYCRQIENLVG